MPDSPHSPTTAYDAVFGDEACPSWARESFDRYVKHGIPTGDFLRAVLAHDLMAAAHRAETDCERALVTIARYVHRHVRLTAHGSYGVVDTWIAWHREERAKTQGAE